MANVKTFEVIEDDKESVKTKSIVSKAAVPKEPAVQKELLVRQSKEFPHLYEVHYENGGELPAVLAGSLFTDKVMADLAIRNYKEKKGK